MAEKYFPNFDEFKDHVASIWLSGNMDSAYRALKHLIVMSKEGEENDLTYDGVMDKWKTHIDIWNRTIGVKDDQFISNKDRALKKPLEQFIEDKEYLNEFSLDVGSQKRDRYLFPAYPIPELFQLMEKIKNIVSTRRKDIANGTIKPED